MILATRENAGRYESIHPRFTQAFDFLMDYMLAGLKPERYEVDGIELYAIVSKDHGKLADHAKLEAHRKYIDIHCVIEGTEQIGWRGIDRCGRVDSPYSTEKDFQTFHEIPESWLVLSPGTIAIFFPEDAHAPMVAAGIVHKAVIKVAI